MTRKGLLVSYLAQDLPASTRRAIKAVVFGALAAAGTLAVTL